MIQAGRRKRKGLLCKRPRILGTSWAGTPAWALSDAGRSRSQHTARSMAPMNQAANMQPTKAKPVRLSATSHASVQDMTQLQKPAVCSTVAADPRTDAAPALPFCQTRQARTASCGSKDIPCRGLSNAASVAFLLNASSMPPVSTPPHEWPCRQRSACSRAGLQMSPFKCRLVANLVIREGSAIAPMMPSESKAEVTKKTPTRWLASSDSSAARASYGMQTKVLARKKRV
mmetsp:Transcript_62183/g.192742  ORF Transcript_62183/g.192742 Transcript_62183/m.192742 type:complete len:230 (+) Transcript_62183:600-1289(+)